MRRAGHDLYRDNDLPSPQGSVRRYYKYSVSMETIIVTATRLGEPYCIQLGKGHSLALRTSRQHRPRNRRR